MNSTEGLYYEVPIINLEDGEMPNIKSPISLHESDQEDCTIIETEKPETSLYCKKLIPAEDDSRNVSIIIDEDIEKNDDCTVIENELQTSHSQYVNNKSTGVNTNSSFETGMLQKSGSQSSSSQRKPTARAPETVHDSPIVLDDDSERKKTFITNNEVFLKENKELARLLEKCLDMENTAGMERILNRTLIPIYKDTTESFKNSLRFKGLLTKTIILLEKDPDKKFSCLKTFCETMKLNIPSRWQYYNKQMERNVKEKKRVQLTTLKRKLNGKFSTNNTRFCSRSIPKKKARLELDVIDLDDDDSCDEKSENNDSDIQLSQEKCETTVTSVQPELISNSDISVEKNENTDNLEMNQSIDDNDVEISEDRGDNVEVDKNIDDSDVEINEDTNDTVEINENTDNVDVNEFTDDNVEINEDTSDNDEVDENIDNSDVEINEDTDDNVEVNENTDKIAVETHEPNENDKTDDDVVIVDGNENRDSEENVTNFNKKKCKQYKGGLMGCNIDIYNDEEIDAINNSLIPVPIDIKIKIERLEIKINAYKKIIEELELEEIDLNSCDEDTAYVRSERYKTEVVNLYKELCKLTGTESVKRHKVRLKVVEGRHEGPMRCLEQFINNNIDNDGNPPFPDMADVIQCVVKANDLYQMGWSKREIEMEAKGLFVYYGRTVKMRRQKREWRDLLRLVKEEVTDPADEDPTLQARLQENAKLALKNEKDLLDRYAQMESSSHRSSIPRIDIDSSENEEVSSENSSESNIVATNNVLSSAEPVADNMTGNKVSSSQTSNNVFNMAEKLTIPPSAQNSIKYLVIDENMRPIGITTEPQNSEPLGYIIEPLKVDITDASLGNYQLVHDSIGSINKNNSHSNLNAKAYENKKKMIQPNIGYFELTDSIQYNEVSTNSDADITNIKTDKNVGNNEVSSSTEVCTKSLDTVNDKQVKIEIKEELVIHEYFETEQDNLNIEDGIVLSENNDKICGLDDVIRSSETGVKIVNDATLSNNGITSQSVTDLLQDKSCKVENDSQTIHSGSKSCELENDSQTINNGNKTSELVKDSELKEIEAKSCELVNDSVKIENGNLNNEIVNNLHFAIENEQTSGEVTNNLQTICRASKSREVINDSQSIENASQSCELVNNGLSSNDLNKAVVKKEKIDIQEMFKALGDDFTVTVLSIEDPFEVIEISDSSDSEDDL